MKDQQQITGERLERLLELEGIALRYGRARLKDGDLESRLATGWVPSEAEQEVIQSAINDYFSAGRALVNACCDLARNADEPAEGGAG